MRRGGLIVYTQKFRFPGTSAIVVADTLRTGALIGAESIFGERPGARVEDAPATAHSPAGRVIRDFSPAPGFRFDVTLRAVEPLLFTATFGQPERRVPYLSGSLLWLFEDADDGAILREDINTERALAHGPALTGARASLRRWLFFKVGHAKLMDLAVANLGRLCTGDRA